MSGLLEDFDRPLGTVGHREAGIVLSACRHDALIEDSPITLVVLAEQIGGKVVTAAVPLAYI
jgi:hypothetical protein